MSGRQPAPAVPVRRSFPLDEIGLEVGLLLVGVILVLQGWLRLDSEWRIGAVAVGLVLALAACAYLCHVMWPLDLTLAERLDRTRDRAAAARPLRTWVLFAIVAVPLVGSAVSGGAVSVMMGVVIAVTNLYLLAYTAQLRRRRGPVIWDELVTARELSSSLLAAKSGRAYRGRFLS